MIGSAQFAGWMVGSLFMPRLGDIYGRKMPFYLSLVAAGFIYLVIILTTSINLQIFNFFLLGIT
jgi:MFS family permease